MALTTCQISHNCCQERHVARTETQAKGADQNFQQENTVLLLMTLKTALATEAMTADTAITARGLPAITMMVAKFVLSIDHLKHSQVVTPHGAW